MAFLLTCRRPFAMVVSIIQSVLVNGLGDVRVRKSPWLLLIFLLIGGLLGGILGEILRVMAPQGTIQTIFATNFTPGISPSHHRSDSRQVHPRLQLQD